MSLLRGKLPVILIILICVVSRLPQLLSANLILDGDECVVALMAKHIYYGKEFPLFFYGQAYGFTLIECLAIVPFYAIMGISTLSAKLAMLMLWTAGCVYLYKAFVKINKVNTLVPILMMILFILCPAWAVWSMKARGGYLTSFAATSVLLYALFHQTVRKDLLRFVIIGILLALIYESQPLWLPGLAPLIVYKLCIEPGRIKRVIAMLVPLALVLAAFHFYISGLSVHYDAHPFIANRVEFLLLAKVFLYHLYSSLHGYYYLWFILKPDIFSAALAILSIGVIFLLPLVALYNVITRRKDTLLFNVSTLSVSFTLVVLFFARSESLRYFLPVTGYTLFSLTCFFQTTGVRMKSVYWATSFVIIMGAASAISFKNYKVSWLSEKNVHDVISNLESKDIHYVYTCSFMLPYYINFYSNEQVLCRDWAFPGRYPPYAKKVDSALDNHAKTALIGYDSGDYCGINAQPIEHFENFYIIEDVPKNELAKSFSFK